MIKCLKGHKSLGLLVNAKIKSGSVSERLSDQWVNQETWQWPGAMALHTGQPGAESISFLWRRLSVLLQIGNCAILGNKLPTFLSPDIDGTM